MARSARCIAVGVLSFVLVTSSLLAADGMVNGRLTDPQGQPVAGAKVRVGADGDLKGRESTTDRDGRFVFTAIPPGAYKLAASSPEFVEVSRTLNLTDGGSLTVDLQFARVAPRSESVTVTADVKDLDIQNPDPAQRIFGSR